METNGKCVPKPLPSEVLGEPLLGDLNVTKSSTAPVVGMRCWANLSKASFAKSQRTGPRMQWWLAATVPGGEERAHSAVGQVAVTNEAH